MSFFGYVFAFNSYFPDNTGGVNDRKDEIRGYKSYGKRRSLRLPDVDYGVVRAYHVTWATVDRKQALIDPHISIPVIQELQVEALDGKILVYAYCVMPDHIHLLISPQGGQNIVSFVQAYKSRTTQIYWRTGNRGRLWQAGFYDRILREEQDVKEVARYILDNPVRKGLVDDFLEHPFSGSLVFDKEDL